jgi:hypothetical protein
LVRKATRGEEIVAAHDSDITVYVDNSAGPQLVGSILPFNIEPPADKTEGDMGGVKVRFGRGKYGNVCAVYVRDQTDAYILLNALSRR